MIGIYYYPHMFVNASKSPQKMWCSNDRWLHFNILHVNKLCGKVHDVPLHNFQISTQTRICAHEIMRTKSNKNQSHSQQKRPPVNNTNGGQMIVYNFLKPRTSCSIRHDPYWLITSSGLRSEWCIISSNNNLGEGVEPWGILRIPFGKIGEP